MCVIHLYSGGATDSWPVPTVSICRGRSAALSCYSVLSLPPLLVCCICPFIIFFGILLSPIRSIYPTHLRRCCQVVKISESPYVPDIPVLIYVFPSFSFPVPHILHTDPTPAVFFFSYSCNTLIVRYYLDYINICQYHMHVRLSAVLSYTNPLCIYSQLLYYFVQGSIK